MIDDRDYMRQPSGGDRQWSWQWPQLSLTLWLIIINITLFVLQLISYQVFPPANPFSVPPTDAWFALSLEGMRHGFVWQFVTFQFMHANFWHLTLNCLTIFFFGRVVEMTLGRSRFLALYLASGILGGVVQMSFALAMPNHFGGAVVGASAGASGLVAAFAVLNWQERFTLLLYFIPVTMRGRTLFWLSIALAVVGILTPNSGIANAAHLGGIITGFFYVRWLLRDPAPERKPPVIRNETRALVALAKENKFWQSKVVPPAEELSAEEFLQLEVDPILEKITAHGIQSLTSSERAILENARKKMNRP